MTIDETEAEYWDDVQGIAAEAKQIGRDGGNAERALEEGAQWADWVLMTRRALLVLLWSPNDSALFEEAGDEALACCDSMATAVCRMASAALLKDAREAFEELPDEDEDEDEEAGTDPLTDEQALSRLRIGGAVLCHNSLAASMGGVDCVLRGAADLPNLAHYIEGNGQAFGPQVVHFYAADEGGES